jgi:arsenate reductase (thioredoxin)
MKSIMFLCTGNSCRSQMAEGFCRKYWGKDFDVFSAGTKKHGMNERAMKVMQEKGIDLSSHYSKTIEELPRPTFDFVVTVCDAASETCPIFPGGKIVHVGFRDPPALTKNLKNEDEILALYREVRDEIEIAIKNLPSVLGINR